MTRQVAKSRFLPLAFVLPTVLIESQSGLNYIVVTGEKN
jgi:hypothetical protein